MSDLTFQVKRLEVALALERHQRLAAIEQSEARIRSALSMDKVDLQCSSESQRLSQPRGIFPAMGVDGRRSFSRRINQLSRAVEKETQDREALEASMHEAMLELQVDFTSLDKEVTCFIESCAEFQQLEEQRAQSHESQMKEIQEGLERDCYERKQDLQDVKSGAADLQVDFEKACTLILNEVANLSQELKVEGEARQMADENIRQELLDEMERKFHLKNMEAFKDMSRMVENKFKEMSPMGMIPGMSKGSSCDSSRECSISPRARVASGSSEASESPRAQVASGASDSSNSPRRVLCSVEKDSALHMVLRFLDQ